MEKKSTTLRICDYCQQPKSWLWSGKRLKDGSKVYLDAHGRRWSGKRCADCEKQRVQTAIRFNSFDRAAITEKLEHEGYKIIHFSNPMLVEKDGKTTQVNLHKARVEKDHIALEKPLDQNDSPCLLVFTSSRIFTKEELANLSLQSS